MSKYVIKRKDVCAGQLMENNGFSVKIYDQNNNIVTPEQLKEQGIDVSFSGGIICRGMLFNVNENGLANDLIYTTPTNYSIEGIQSKINIESDFVIQNYIELEELLKYLKYGEDLTQKDLNQIFKKLITSKKWLNNHHELFGWKKIGIGEYCSGGTETLPMTIYTELNNINCCENGNPHRDEPEYSLIKRKR